MHKKEVHFKLGDPSITKKFILNWGIWFGSI